MVGILGAVGAGAAGGAVVSVVINAVDKFSKTFAGLNTKLLGVGVGLTAIGAIGVGVMGGLVKQAMSFESAFIGVRKTVELSEKEFEELEDRFKSMAKTIPLTFQELAGIGEIAGQLGVTGVDNIAQFVRTIADISATTNLTAEQAATDFARFANIMQMPISQVDRLGSVVVDLGNNLATTEAEIVGMSMRIAGAGSVLGMTEGQVMAWGAALSSMGIRVEAGGTAISKLMINISSMVATGSEDLKGFAEVAGMTTGEFSKLFKEDASKALQVFFTGLGNIKEQGGDVLATLEELNISEVRLRDAVLRLASGSDTLNSSLDIQKKAWEDNTALSEEAEKRYESMESQLIILKNQFKILGAELGEVLFPIVTKIIGVVTKLTDWFANLTDGQKKWIVIIGAGATALALILGPLLILVALLPAMAAGIGIVAGAFAFLLGPIGLVIAAVAALVALVVLLWKNWDKISGFVGKVGGFIGGGIEKILGSKQAGGMIPQTGLYNLHKGEVVVPARQVSSGGKGGLNVFINNLNGFNSRDIADNLQRELNKKITL